MPGRQNQGRYDTALQSFVHEEDRMRKQTKADGDSSFQGARGSIHFKEIAFAMQEFLSRTAG
jgi:hypothetical protein